MMTTEELRDLLARCTPGPWRQEDGTTLVWGVCNPDDKTTNGMGYPVATARTKLGFDGQWREDTGMANTALIALSPTLAAELIEARAEIERLRDMAKMATPDEHRMELYRMKNEALTAERDALREALRKYGRHKPSCNQSQYPAWGECNCGFEQASAALKENRDE